MKKEKNQQNKRSPSIFEESASLFSSISIIPNNWIWEVDSNGVYTYCSPGVYDIFGYLPEEIIGKRLFDFLTPEDGIILGVIFQNAIINKTAISNLEISTQNKNGKDLFFVVNGSPFFDLAGDLIGYRGINHDITALKEKEAKLSVKRLMLKTLLESIPDLVWLKDANGVYLACNPKFERLFGASESEIVGKTDCDFVSKELADSFRMKDKEAIAANKSSVYQEWVSYADDGHCEFIETIKTPMHDSDGNLTAILGIARDNSRTEVIIDGEKQTGIIRKVSWETIERLIKWYEWNQYHEQQGNESLSDDPERFKSLNGIDAKITVNLENSKAISDLLIGIFFEDINYAADGGLYAELVQNRGFEYAPGDKEGRDKTWNSAKSWSFTGAENGFSIDTIAPIHPNQKHYAVLNIAKQGEAFLNEGFDGILVNAGDKYDLSVYVRGLNGAKGKLLIQLVGETGKLYGETYTKNIGADWKKYEVVITAKESNAKTHLKIIPQFTGKVALDMVSLFPQKTFKGHKNGLRADLAQTIADIHPKFIRFPGGCVAHGDGLHNMYRWKNTVGPLETRVPQRNIWGYHQTAGLGYFEYFQYCEDIGAEPLPILAAGVPCQNSATGGHGQQGGVPMCEMDNYVQEILDLIEWANGDKNTKFGKLRADAGHPKPFNLKYIGIGNEDLISDIFEERFTMIYNAIRKNHPEIIVVGTAGANSKGSTDYAEGWSIATKLEVPIIDEHYYQPPGWFINNQDYYDSYDRTKSKVYLGEYAAHIPGSVTNIETALSEALYLTSLERNGDVVSMASYAPLLAKEGHTQWNPDLIYFNNTEVKPTVDYFIQKLFGQNAGDTYLANQITFSDKNENIRKRVAVSVVRDSKSKDVIVKMVNLLPVAINTTVDLGEIGSVNPNADCTTLTGAPDDKTARPVTEHISVSNKFPCSLPAYSFSLIRIKTN